MNVRHVVPTDDLIEHDNTWDGDSDGAECVCGPKVEFVSGGAVVVHFSLDGRESQEKFRDWASALTEVGRCQIAAEDESEE